MTLVKWIRLFRVHQWSKNVFIFFPLIFSGQFFNQTIFNKGAFLFASFCLVSSGFYIFNDISDKSRDVLHPRKSKRPIPAGDIPIPAAFGIALTAVVAGLFIAGYTGLSFLILTTLYILLQMLYNRVFKHVVLWDVIFLAAGFLLRIWIGAQAASVPVSFWLFMCVFVLALFLGFAKRRGEITLMKGEAQQHREVLSQYGVYFLDQVLLLSACLAIVFYSLYTISPEVVAKLGGRNLVFSVVFVIYGMLRYLYLIHMQKIIGDDPAELLVRDKPLLLAVACWIFYLMFMLYFVG